MWCALGKSIIFLNSACVIASKNRKSNKTRETLTAYKLIMKIRKELHFWEQTKTKQKKPEINKPALLRPASDNATSKKNFFWEEKWRNDKLTIFFVCLKKYE